MNRSQVEQRIANRCLLGVSEIERRHKINIRVFKIVGCFGVAFDVFVYSIRKTVEKYQGARLLKTVEWFALNSIV